MSEDSNVGGIFGLISDIVEITKPKPTTTSSGKNQKEHFSLQDFALKLIFKILANCLVIISALHIALNQDSNKLLHAIAACCCSSCYLVYAVVIGKIVQ
jgi:hypothetical protein